MGCARIGRTILALVVVYRAAAVLAGAGPVGKELRRLGVHLALCSIASEGLHGARNCVTCLLIRIATARQGILGSEEEYERHLPGFWLRG